MRSEHRENIYLSEKEMETILQSTEAVQLLQILKKDGGSGLTRAMESVRSGNYMQAVACMKPMLDSPDAEILLRELNKKLGRT